MSQQSASSSSSKATASPSPTATDPRANVTAMDAEILEVTPLHAMAADPTKVKKLRTRHAKRSQASPTGKYSQPSSSVPPEIANREGSAYVHQAIARLVTRILNENHSVPGVSVPLNQETASPNLESDPNVTQNVETPDENIEKSLEKPADHQTPTDKVVEPPVIDVDEEFSDNDLIASVNPSIVRRMMSRKEKQSAAQSPSKEKATEVVHENPGSENKAREEAEKDQKAGTSKGKSRVKSVGSISRPKRTPISKKGKAHEPSESDDESDFDLDVEGNVPDIPLRKKPSSRKLPKVPEVAIDNISFHHPENASR